MTSDDRARREPLGARRSAVAAFPRAGYDATMTTKLETPRLRLREMTEADAPQLLALNANPNVLRFIVGEAPLASIEAAVAVLRERVLPQYALGLGRWACIEKSTGDYVGWCGLKHLADEDAYDLGYRFFERCWGRGYASEAARAVAAFARTALVGKRIVGKAMVGNVASRRVLEKIGMVHEGDVEEEGCLVAVYALRAEASAPR